MSPARIRRPGDAPFVVRAEREGGSLEHGFADFEGLLVVLGRLAPLIPPDATWSCERLREPIPVAAQPASSPAAKLTGAAALAAAFPDPEEES